MTNVLTIAVIGDVHDQWSPLDGESLTALGVDLALFVGDFGNEVVPLIAEIADLSLPKAVILGNHDAWFSATPWGRKKAPYSHRQEDRVQQQLDLLQGDHVGYGRRDFTPWDLAVVGGRPFSWGGGDWKHGEFLQERFGVDGFQASADRIAANAITSPAQTLIFLGHNGPLGLGREPEAPCGKDWFPLGGDHGDPDLALAIAQVRLAKPGKKIALVAFGHMHHRLRHRHDRPRQRVVQDDQGTVYFNAACVPRLRTLDGAIQRQFGIVQLQQGAIQTIENFWLGPHHEIMEKELLFSAGS